MTTIPSSLTSFAQGSAGSAPTPIAQLSPTGDGSAGRFKDVLAQALDVQAQNNGVSPPDAAAQAQERARRALALPDGAAPVQGARPGDAVLNGLEKIRGVFDQQISQFATSSAQGASSEGLFRAQVAAANFSLFMEVGSKLAGKTTQAFETLLKGQ